MKRSIKNGSMILNVPKKIENCSKDCKVLMRIVETQDGDQGSSSVKKQRFLSTQPIVDVHFCLKQLNEKIIGNDWPKQEIIIALHNLNEGGRFQPLSLIDLQKWARVSSLRALQEF
jgi:hypothetical protein